MDYQSILSGDFEKVILENIKARAHFLVILTPSALERCKEPNDWLRREIETAMDEKRNIVPLMLDSFDFGSQLVIQALTGKLAKLNAYNGLRVYAEYFFDAMKRLREGYLNVALTEIALPSLNIGTQEITKTQQTAASKAKPVGKEELTAQEWFERGYIFGEAENFDEAIRCLTEAIHLNPNSAQFFHNRGLTRQIKGDLTGAIEDYTESIRIRPGYGVTRIALLGIYKRYGRTKEADEQERELRLLMQNVNEYNCACFEAICGNVDKSLELLKIGLEKKQQPKQWARKDPDFENIRNDPRFKALVEE